MGRNNERETRITAAMERQRHRQELAREIERTIAGRRFDGADQSDILAALSIVMQHATRIEMPSAYAAAALSEIGTAAGSPPPELLAEYDRYLADAWRQNMAALSFELWIDNGRAAEPLAKLLAEYERYRAELRRRGSDVAPTFEWWIELGQPAAEPAGSPAEMEGANA